MISSQIFCLDTEKEWCLQVWECLFSKSSLNAFAAKLQTAFVVCFFYFNKLIWSLYVKLKNWMSNSIEPAETAHYEHSHLDLSCLQKPSIIACGSERVKRYLPFGATSIRGDNTGIPPFWYVVLNPFQHSWLGIQIVHWDIKETLKKYYQKYFHMVRPIGNQHLIHVWI